MTWCEAVSLFVHVTESPACTETAPGENPALVMSTATVFVVLAGAGAATSKATAPASNMSLFICISSPPGSRYLDRWSAAVLDSHGIAPGLEVTRARLVRRHVRAVRRCALDVRSREDAPRVRAELQLLDRDPLTELRPALQVHRAPGERRARRELREETRAARAAQRHLRTHLRRHRLARHRLPAHGIARERR